MGRDMGGAIHFFEGNVRIQSKMQRKHVAPGACTVIASVMREEEGEEMGTPILGTLYLPRMGKNNGETRCGQVY